MQRGARPASHCSAVLDHLNTLEGLILELFIVRFEVVSLGAGTRSAPLRFAGPLPNP